jgi:hypothetical protein
MRRRQIYEAQRAAPVVALSVSEPPRGPVAVLELEPRDKHACPHCGKVYPRGLHLHVNRCPKKAA